MGEQLKPCPFCDGDASVSQNRDRHPNDGEWDVECLSCCAEIRKEATRETAIAAWNRRARSEGPHPESGEPAHAQVTFENAQEICRMLLVQAKLGAALRKLVDACHDADERGELAEEIDGSLLDEAEAAIALIDPKFQPASPPPLEGAGRAEDGSSQGLGGHPCGDRFGVIDVPEYAMPISVHMQWCKAVASEEEEPTP